MGLVGGALALAVLVLPLGARAASSGATAILNEPTTPVLDTFDGRGLEDPLDQWGNWAPISIDGGGATMEALGGVAGHDEGDIRADSYRVAEIPAGAAEVYGTVAVSPSDQRTMSLYLHLQEAGTSGVDGYELRWFHWIAGDGLYLRKVVDGVSTNLVPPVQLSNSDEPGGGSKLLLRQAGGTLQVWHGRSDGTWVLRLSASDGSFRGGKLGFGSYESKARWADFGGTGQTTPEPPPPTLPLTGVLDDFERPNEDPLSQAGAWSDTPISGSGLTLEVLGASAGHDEDAFAYGDSYRPTEHAGDTEVYATLADTPDDNEPMYLFLHLRELGGAGWDGYRLHLQDTITGGSAAIQRVTDGVATTLIAGGSGLQTGQIYLLRRLDDSLQLWRKSAGTWTRLLSFSDSTYDRGSLGAGVDDDSSRWDDFGGGEIDAPQPPPPPPPPSSKPPVEQTFGAGESEQGVHGRCGCALFADPVNSRTGAFTTSVDDFDLPGTGVSFAWSRHYTSADRTVGRLGRGWTDSYSASLAIQENGDVLLHAEDGQQLFYTRQTDGSFAGAPGSLSTLVAVADGYELVRVDQVTYRFGSDGRLHSMKDRNGQGVTLTYDGQDRIATVTDASGREASLSYDAEGLVSRVQAQDGRSVGYGYSAGRLTSVTDVAGGTWAYTYDAAERLATIRDPLGHVQVTNVYGADGRVQSQTDALGKSTTFAWDEASEIATATDARGGVWKHDYEDGALARQVDAFQSQTEVVHDADLNTTSVTGPSGETTSMTYDSAGNMLTATAPASLGSARKTFVYNGRNDPVRVTDARGKVTDYAYDPASGRLTTVTQDGTRIASYTYDSAGRIETFTDANEKTWTYQYTPSGLLAVSLDPLGNATSYTYDAAGRVATQIDPKGNVAGCGCASVFTSRFTYDEAGRLLSQTNPLGHTTRNVYDAAGRLSSSTDALDRTTLYAYDDANRLLTATSPDPDGAGPLAAPVTASTYDDVGNKVSETDPRGGRTLFAYDTANRLVSETGPDPDGAGPLAAPATTHVYDDSGNLTSTVEPRGSAAGVNPADFRTTFTYDAAGRRLTETRPDPDGSGSQVAATTTNVYDSVGNLRSLRDGNDHVTSYTHDAAGRVLTVIAPDLGVTTYGYDDEGSLASRRDDAGHVTSFEYDAAGNLVSETSPDPDGSGPQTPGVTSHTYDANGNRVTTTDANGNSTTAAGDGTTAYGYDRANRLVAIDYSDATPDVSFTLDAAGNRLSMTDGSGTETRTYDALDRLLTVTRGGTTFTYAYDLASNVTRRASAGIVVDYTYDGLNRLAAVSSGGQQTGYEYDAASNLVRATLPAGNGYVERRAYDRAGRLVEVKSQRGANVLSSFAATLDPVGNPTQIVRTGSLAETRIYGYDSNDRLVSACFQASTCAGSGDPFIRWTYDKLGNRLTEQRPGATTTYTYDARDRLLTAGSTIFAHDQNGNQLRNGSRTFSYDLANRMISTTQGNSTTTYVYDGDDKRVQASTGAQASRKSNFLWDVSLDLPQLAIEEDGAGSTVRRYVYGIRPVSMTAGNNTSYFVYDGLGSVVHLTSASGATQWTWSYEPFGGARVQQKANGKQPANSLRFAGEYLDPTDLYHLRARQYDPALGRFLRADPVARGTGSTLDSLYAYVGNRPTVMVDPSGEVFRWADEGSTRALFPTTLVEWQSPRDRCLSPLCGPTRRPTATPSLVHPIPLGYSPSHGAKHRTGGLEPRQYWAYDFFPGVGAPVLAVQSGLVRKLSGNDPARGEVAFGIYGWSVYLRADSGSDFFYTHLGSRSVNLGARVRAGDVIGRVGRWIRPNGENKSHLHLGVDGGPITIEMVVRARRIRA